MSKTTSNVSIVRAAIRDVPRQGGSSVSGHRILNAYRKDTGSGPGAGGQQGAMVPTFLYALGDSRTGLWGIVKEIERVG